MAADVFTKAAIIIFVCDNYYQFESK